MLPCYRKPDIGNSDSAKPYHGQDDKSKAIPDDVAPWILSRLQNVRCEPAQFLAFRKSCLPLHSWKIDKFARRELLRLVLTVKRLQPSAGFESVEIVTELIKWLDTALVFSRALSVFSRVTPGLLPFFPR